MLNEFRNIMADTGQVWLWGWLGYLFTSTTLALGYSKGIKGDQKGVRESEGGERSGDKETRKVPQSIIEPEGRRDKYSKTAQLSLSEKERRILEQDREIAKLQSNLFNFIHNQYRSGEVDRLPDTEDLIFTIGKGVTSKLLETDSVHTVYSVVFERESYIPEHNHVQEELINVIHGKVKLELIDSDNNITDKIILEKGDSFLINPYIDHVTSSNDGAKAVITFEPPMIKFDEYHPRED